MKRRMASSRARRVWLRARRRGGGAWEDGEPLFGGAKLGSVGLDATGWLAGWECRHDVE